MQPSGLPCAYPLVKFETVTLSNLLVLRMMSPERESRNHWSTVDDPAADAGSGAEPAAIIGGPLGAAGSGRVRGRVREHAEAESTPHNSRRLFSLFREAIRADAHRLLRHLRRRPLCRGGGRTPGGSAPPASSLPPASTLLALFLRPPHLGRRSGLRHRQSRRGDLSPGSWRPRRSVLRWRRALRRSARS